MNRTCLLGLAACLFAAQPTRGADELKSHKAEEKPLSAPGKGVEVLATLSDSSFSFHPVSGPAFAIALTVRNHTAQTLELGEALVVLEQEKGGPAFVGAFQSRERAKPAARLLRFERRYGLGWGEPIDKEGAALLSFVGGGRFSFSRSRPGAYEGLGFGKVSPNAERTLKLNLPFPFKLKGERASLALVAPSVRGAGAPFETIVRFEPKPGADKAYAVVASETIPLQAAALQKLAADTARTGWERLFALNWLAETAPQAAEPLLFGVIDQADAGDVLRSGSILALGVARSSSAVERLLAIASSSQPVPVRQAAVLALGDIGDAKAAPALRALLENPESSVAGAAIESVGRMKDDAAVAPLAALFRDTKKGHAFQAGQALVAIGTPAAREALIGALDDRADDVRQAAARRLTDSGWQEAVPALARLVADAKAGVYTRRAGLDALAKLGGDEALAAIRATLSDASEELYAAALTALLSKDAKAAEAAAVVALGSRHASVRREAGQTLKKAKPADATGPLWAAYQKETDPSAGAALQEALVELKFTDAAAIDWLLPRLDAKKNKLWHEDTLLLKQLSGQDLGPKHKYGDDKERDAALASWREWGRTRK